MRLRLNHDLKVLRIFWVNHHLHIGVWMGLGIALYYTLKFMLFQEFPESWGEAFMAGFIGQFVVAALVELFVIAPIHFLKKKEAISLGRRSYTSLWGHQVSVGK